MQGVLRLKRTLNHKVDTKWGNFIKRNQGTLRSEKLNVKVGDVLHGYTVQEVKKVSRLIYIIPPPGKTNSRKKYGRYPITS
jgi:hypothetical protein